MSIKKAALFFGLLFSTFIIGCSDYLKGKKEEPRVIELSDTHFACLQKLPDQWKKFFAGEGQKNEIEDGFNCLTDAFRNFHKRTFGSVEGGYTPEDLRKFFGKYFLKQNNITSEFAAELMKLKRVLLGGSETSLSKDELLQLIDILEILKNESVKLIPHVKTLTFKGDEKTVTWDQLSNSSDQLRGSLQNLLAKTHISTAEYTFDDLKKVFYDFAEFVKGEDQRSIYDLYAKWLPVIESVKNVFIGVKPQITTLSQWKESLDTLLDLYNLSLRYHYFLRDFKLENNQKLNYLSQAVGQGIKVLSNAYQMKNTGRIPVENIDELIEQVMPLVNTSVKTKSLKKAYRVVLLKILDPERKGDSIALLGLEKKHLAVLRREFNIWRLQQSFINSAAGNDGTQALTSSELLDAYGKFNRTYVIEKNLTTDPLEQNVLEQSWNDLGELLAIPYPISFNQNGRLNINGDMVNLKQDWKSLTEANVMRSLSRMLLLGYADNVQGPLAQASLSKPGLIAWYADFQELGLDLKAFDPRAANSGARSFLEANFFMFSGNGDDSMDQKETYEFVSFLFSAGLSSSESVRKDFLGSACLDKNLDVFGYPFLSEPCFKNQLKEKFDFYFNNLPALVKYVKGLDSNQWDAFYSYLLSASKVEEQRDGFVETANVRTMIMILHYTESILALYDKDGDQALSLDEVYAATPRFMSFVKTMSSVKSEAIMKEGFAYLVFKGKVPGVMDLVKFEMDKIHGLPGAQRMELVRLFGTLKDQLNKSKN
ncbi:MAG: hypothetical protein ACXVCY_03585 [Pseudobdellovibrionaceae bacterium]